MTSRPERWHLDPGKSKPQWSLLLPGPPLRSRTLAPPPMLWPTVGFGGPCLRRRGLHFLWGFGLDFLCGLGLVEKKKKDWDDESRWWQGLEVSIFCRVWIFVWSVGFGVMVVDDGGWLGGLMVVARWVGWWVGWWWWLGGCGLILRWIFLFK